ncbi:hypothetical protein EDB80DRAFT_699202 [Ilyonectria destructans]|nr:hypothetical protein EDB80DRAFT_699202 [Ilyonectria destructans]
MATPQGSEIPQPPTLHQGAGWKARLRIWAATQIEDRENVGNPLTRVSEYELREGIRKLAEQLPDVETHELERAGRIAKNSLDYYHFAKGSSRDASLPVDLTSTERDSLVAEREKLFLKKGMFIVICTVSLAAFLQGHVQSSINAGSIFADRVGIERPKNAKDTGFNTSAEDWKLGAMNAIPFLTAAFPGAPLSLPVNYCLGRRGALGLSALLIVASSLGSAFATTWVQLLGARVVGGVGMGIKAVSAPILASETAVGYWRGSTVLAWQLWVACGIMVGFGVNLIIAAVVGTLESQPVPPSDSSHLRRLTLQLILGAPLVPALLLFVAVCFCYESPRFYMRPNTPNFNLERAFNVLLAVRETRLQALRDLLLIWWSNVPQTEEIHTDSDTPRESGNNSTDSDNPQQGKTSTSGLTYAGRVCLVLKLSADQYGTLLKTRRLRNAVLSTCTVALAQQLCGINVFAFYSNELLGNYGVQRSMSHSVGFGAVNFVFSLLAMRSIDTIGRRRWLLSTLPVMSAFLMASAIAFVGDESGSQPGGIHVTVGIVFIYLFVAAYSPGMGPIPFTLASESFPLSHREAGASVAISINLLFAGLLTILLPTINKTFKITGTLGSFAGLNVVAFILIYFLVEETKRLTLEELDDVYDNPKSMFAGYQLKRKLPYYFNRYVLFRREGNEELESYETYAMEMVAARNEIRPGNVGQE